MTSRVTCEIRPFAGVGIGWRIPVAGCFLEGQCKCNKVFVTCQCCRCGIGLLDDGDGGTVQGGLGGQHSVY